jgi:hypothetical protein
MTTNDQQVAQALKKAVAEGEQPDSPEARARTVAALQVAMKSGAVSPPARRAMGRWAVAAGFVVLGAAGLWWQAQPRGIARVLASGGTLRVGHRLADAAVVESGQAAMTLELPRGVMLHLEPETSVQLRDDGARVVVRRGEVAAEVTSLDAPFFLESGDTQVSTRGAKLKVKTGAGCDGRTEVQVSEGAAAVNGEHVPAGEGWPRCAPVVMDVMDEPVLPAPRPTTALRERTRSTPPPPERTRILILQKDEDRLARQNELYLQAVTLQRGGDLTGAVKKLEAVLADPGSPLAETALAQKMKWLSAKDRPAAQEAAREYLQRFPMGFGRADAATLVLEPK